MYEEISQGDIPPREFMAQLDYAWMDFVNIRETCHNVADDYYAIVAEYVKRAHPEAPDACENEADNLYPQVMALINDVSGGNPLKMIADFDKVYKTLNEMKTDCTPAGFVFGGKLDAD